MGGWTVEMMVDARDVSKVVKKVYETARNSVAWMADVRAAMRDDRWVVLMDTSTVEMMAMMWVG